MRQLFFSVLIVLIPLFSHGTKKGFASTLYIKKNCEDLVKTDSQGRIIEQHVFRINCTLKLVSYFTYDGLGQLSQKKTNSFNKKQEFIWSSVEDYSDGMLVETRTFNAKTNRSKTIRYGHIPADSSYLGH